MALIQKHYRKHVLKKYDHLQSNKTEWTNRMISKAKQHDPIQLATCGRELLILRSGNFRG